MNYRVMNTIYGDAVEARQYCPHCFAVVPTGEGVLGIAGRQYCCVAHARLDMSGKNSEKRLAPSN